MSLQYIRDTYGVPAKRGGKVHYAPNQSGGVYWHGRITGSHGGNLRIVFGPDHRMIVHPTDERLTYCRHVSLRRR